MMGKWEGNVTLPNTSPSLLGRLRILPTDESAWQEFVDRYSNAIHDWCRVHRLQDADGNDVAQTVLTKLAVRLRTFHYDASMSFRSWLWTVTRHAISDWKNERYGKKSALVDSELLNDVAATDDLLHRLQSAFDMELLDEAYERVKMQVEPKTWKAFWLSAVDQLPGPAIAEQLAMPIANVYMARSNVQKRLRNEIAHLEKK